MYSATCSLAFLYNTQDAKISELIKIIDRFRNSIKINLVQNF